ncbi:LysR family glycine cleavage system transcriptional activator [Pseudorhodoferax soli]|uniref:LysR family glycine cleavage system transcriptional activator n=2 Tax=Pseudorhodoferax soli TaxID=545864 RepID=A0A368XL38_9BURK|nr:LysR family glycine cleavage system transcriptional activator [Pseudorhodoferax soli]
MVRGLEEWLGVPLFSRASGGRARLTVTDGAQGALQDIRAGFDRLWVGLDQLKEQSSRGALTVAVSSAFAGKWLLPRIDGFRSQWPNLDLRLDTSAWLADPSGQGIDIAVRYGAGDWRGLAADRLMAEEVYPVCSPSFIRNASIRTPADLRLQTLIHDVSHDTSTEFVTWESWLAGAGVQRRPVAKDLKITNAAAVLQAASAGQGVALARSVMAEEDIASGSLVRLFPDRKVVSPLAYYAVYKPEAAAKLQLQAFRDWLIAEAQGASFA